VKASQPSSGRRCGCEVDTPADRDAVRGEHPGGGTCRGPLTPNWLLAIVQVWRGPMPLPELVPMTDGPVLLAAWVEFLLLLAVLAFFLLRGSKR
jgi:hypothetical protein